MIWLLLSTFGISVASALIPLINIEIIVAGLSASGHDDALLIATAAGAGQTIGKIVWYEVARRGIDTEWAKKKLSGPKIKASYEKWVERMQGRPWYGALIMFASAFLGFPPLLVMAAVAGALKMKMWAFLPTIFIGRTLRFYLILIGVGLAFT